LQSNTAKKPKLVVVCLSIAAVVILLVAAFCISFPTCFPYCDMWIMGKTYDEIAAVYGETEGGSNLSHRISYYIGEDNGWVMPSHLPQYYYIVFDENGRACDAYKGGPIGG